MLVSPWVPLMAISPWVISWPFIPFDRFQWLGLHSPFALIAQHRKPRDGQRRVALPSGVSTERLQDIFNALRHHSNQLGALFHLDAIPDVMHLVPEVFEAGQSLFQLAEMPANLIPMVLHRVEIGGLSWPTKDADRIVLEPLAGDFGGVGWVIVMSKSRASSLNHESVPDKFSSRILLCVHRCEQDCRYPEMWSSVV